MISAETSMAIEAKPADLDKRQNHALAEHAPFRRGVAHDQSGHAGGAGGRKERVDRIGKRAVRRRNRQHQQQSADEDNDQKAEYDRLGRGHSGLKQPFAKPLHFARSGRGCACVLIDVVHSRLRLLTFQKVPIFFHSFRCGRKPQTHRLQSINRKAGIRFTAVPSASSRSARCRTRECLSRAAAQVAKPLLRPASHEPPLEQAATGVPPARQSAGRRKRQAGRASLRRYAQRRRKRSCRPKTPPTARRQAA